MKDLSKTFAWRYQSEDSRPHSHSDGDLSVGTTIKRPEMKNETESATKIKEKKRGRYVLYQGMKTMGQATRQGSEQAGSEGTGPKARPCATSRCPEI